jgi:hypothetical protein
MEGAIMKKKKSGIFLPIFWTISGCLWVLIFCADFFYPPELGLLMFLHGLCAFMGVVNMVAQWIRYHKDNIKKNDEG